MALKAAVYRVDLGSMFEDTAKVANRSKRELAKALGQQRRAAGGPLHRRATCYNDVMQSALLQHFRDMADAKAVYSLDLSDDMMSGSPLELVAEYFASSTPQLQPQTSPKIFFRIVKSHPSKQKQARVAEGARRRIHDDHIAIHLHAAITIEDLDVRACVSGRRFGEASHNDDALALLVGLDLNESLQTWQLERHLLVFSAEDVSNGVSDALGSLSIGALMASTTNANAIGILKERGALEECNAPDEYRLKQAKLPELRLCLELRRPQNFFTIRESTAITALTLYELLHQLHAAGFEWRRLPQQKKKKAQLEPYCPEQGESKVWYSSGVQPCLDYLRCLLLAKD
eukprot:6329440-Amphidinium_carterae.2